MDLIIRNPWPYLPPLLQVPGINAWHADRERLCIWEEEDNTQRWTTLKGVIDRIDEWVASEAAGFEGVETARNPEIYWRDPIRWVGLVDLDEIVASRREDGAHGEFHFVQLRRGNWTDGPDVYDLKPGPSGVHLSTHQGMADQAMSGRWFYRQGIRRPPRDLDELKDLLTEQQTYYLKKHTNQHYKRGNGMMFGLIWSNSEGPVCTMILADPTPTSGKTHTVGTLRPKGTAAMLLRAGPDQGTLQTKHIAVIGVGAIGSHLVDLLARSRIQRLHLFDHDYLWPANLIRHAASPQTKPGTLKTAAAAKSLAPFAWVEIETPPTPYEGRVWDIHQLQGIVEIADLTIDATGHAGFAEYAARVAHKLRRPYMTVGLFHGGNIARVRRQAIDTDTPVLARKRLDQYPTIRPVDDELEYVGTETGCLARVHNAPPVSVAHAAATAVEVAIDYLCDRHHQPDEVIEVLRTGDEPFHRIGRLRFEDLPVHINITENAQHEALKAAANTKATETGGVLIGCEVNGRLTITMATEISDHSAQFDKYTVAQGATRTAVRQAQQSDPRVGYVGEWHTHPDGNQPSLTDQATMLDLAHQADITDPVLLIVGPANAEPRLRAFMTTETGLRPVNISTCGDLPEPVDLPG